MSLENQLLFFFSAVGAFNGFFLSTYFAFFSKEKSPATYFLAGLILVISIRIIKSSFLFFYPEVHGLFIQVGLTACALIGPFLYLHVRAIKLGETAKHYWALHVLSTLTIMILLGILYPYKEYRHLWRLDFAYFGFWLYLQWLLYILAAAYQLRSNALRLFRDRQSLHNQDAWLLSITIGVFIVWLAYSTIDYTSYIVGALSFSFVFYLLILLWFFRRKNVNIFSPATYKYNNKSISAADQQKLATQLDQLVRKEQLFQRQDLKMPAIAKELQISPHTLSQYLNEELGKNFTSFINEYRVEAAAQLLLNRNELTLEAIGQSCGFRSNSAFYQAFKKIKGVTPGQYKKASSDL